MSRFRPWWLFFGVATEVERHRYYTDVELFGRAIVRFGRQLDDVGRRLGEALLPACQLMIVSIADMGRALNRALVP